MRFDMCFKFGIVEAVEIQAGQWGAVGKRKQAGPGWFYKTAMCEREDGAVYLSAWYFAAK